MKVLALALFVAISLSAFNTVATAQSSKENSDSKIDEAFHGGNALMEQNKYCEAEARYKEGLALTPEDTSFLYNGGLAAYQCKDFSTATQLWSKLKTIDPSDWQVRAKLIQSYQAAGKLTERDAERSELFQLRQHGESNELTNQDRYCREQFEAGGEKVMAFEHFELKGDRAVRYVFSVLDATGKAEKYYLSLGSYETTNAIWHETTKPRPKDSERLFHLDGYYSWGHATYGMYSPEPSYDKIREAVIEILEKKKEPVSSSTVMKNK